MSFSLQKDKRGVVVVGVDGQLIVGNRQELKQKVLDALDGGGRKFVIDFTKTGYIDSSGLGVLVSLSKKIREQGGDLRLCGLKDRKSTRLNSSHPSISYAVFCLKKKLARVVNETVRLRRCLPADRSRL